MTRKFNPRKNQINIEKGRVSVEDILTKGTLVKAIKHKSRPEQFYELYDFMGYPWIVVVNSADGRVVTHFADRRYKKELKK